MALRDAYLKNLAKRGKESRVYRKFQAIGVEIAEMLKDAKHTSLYIKLAKESNSKRLLELAKDVAARKEVKRPGAYFMRIVSLDPALQPKHKPRKK